MSIQNGFSRFGSIISAAALLGAYVFVFFFYAQYGHATLRYVFGVIALVAAVWLATLQSPYTSNGKFWALIAILFLCIGIVAGFGAQSMVDKQSGL